MMASLLSSLGHMNEHVTTIVSLITFVMVLRVDKGLALVAQRLKALEDHERQVADDLIRFRNKEKTRAAD